jgi:uncharacterized membrane protein YhiD involved in acid resistance
MRGALIALLLTMPLLAQAPPVPAVGAEQTLEDLSAKEKKNGRGDALDDPAPDVHRQFEQLRHALARLPLAAVLATVLAMRPRRKGTPPRQLPVIQTQIILAIVGAVVMLVVGSSLARAFGIVGAAGLVRYRAKIDDPKDAGVMLSTLAIGLASGVGLWVLAVFSAGFILAVLWVIESFEPKATKLFSLTVKAKDTAALKLELEKLMTRRRLDYQLRTSAPEELTYDVHFPIERKTDHLSEQILKLEADATVQWEEKKEKK